MPKKQKVKRFSIQAYDAAHYRLTEQYTQAVEALFNRATDEVSRVAEKSKYNPDKPFAYADCPSVKSVMQDVVKQLASRMVAVVESGSRKQWLFCCDKNDAFIGSIMDTSKLTKARLNKMQDRNLDALSAFQKRKVDGLDLSQRVWKYVKQYRDQLEVALDVGLGEGRSAAQLSRDVRQNLKDPDRLFRRVRDKRGNLGLSKAAKAFHPGQGVYRSSYKNAMRLTRSEINMAYRESDYNRWQQLDFVVGFEIHRSNHEPLCKCDLCAKLVGRYPKTFKFVGWHPQCMCYAIPILMDDETFDTNELGDLKAALHGTQYKRLQAKNLVTDVPEGFAQWVDEHADKQKNWGSTPYFIRDNFKNGQLSDGLKIALPVTSVAGKVDFHIPFEKLPSEERMKFSTEMTNRYMDDMDLVDACKIYGIDAEWYNQMADEIIDNNQYWRVPELDVSRNRLQAQLMSKIDEYRSLAQQKISEYEVIAKGAEEWIGDKSDVVRSARDLMTKEASKKYPNYKSILPSLDDSLNITKLREEIELAKAEYSEYLSQAKDVVKVAHDNKINASEVENDITTGLSNILNWIKVKLDFRFRLLKLKDKIVRLSTYDIPSPPDDVEEDLNVGNVEIIAPKVPSVTYTHDDKNKTFEERAKNYYDALDALYGSSENCQPGYKGWWQSIKANYATYKGKPAYLDLHVIQDINKYIGDGIGEHLDAIAHLGELAKAADLDKIPMKWRTIFNDYIKKIESADIAKDGYLSMYREIEGAYNIYRLSTNKDAIAYGLGKISPKMPCQVFDIAKKVGYDISENMPRKAFFDSLEEFVPLSINGKGGTACFLPSFNFVRIPINNTKTKERFDASSYYRKSLFYHEFGHARDMLSPRGKWHKSKEWKDLFAKFEKEIQKDNGVALETAILNKVNDLGIMNVYTGDHAEMMGNLTDTVQSLVKGHRYIWAIGHPISYWTGNHDLIEFIAHASENYWGGNDLFKELYPDLFNEMCKLMKKMQ